MIDKATAAAIWEILVVECGAHAAHFVDLGFADYLASNSGRHIEWRFSGRLGWGGKFRTDSQGRNWRVDCYPEDENPYRLRQIRRANERLALLEKREVNHLTG